MSSAPASNQTSVETEPATTSPPVPPWYVGTAAILGGFAMLMTHVPMSWGWMSVFEPASDADAVPTSPTTAEHVRSAIALTGTSLLLLVIRKRFISTRWWRLGIELLLINSLGFAIINATLARQDVVFEPRTGILLSAAVLALLVGILYWVHADNRDLPEDTP